MQRRCRLPLSGWLGIVLVLFLGSLHPCAVAQDLDAPAWERRAQAADLFRLRDRLLIRGFYAIEQSRDAGRWSEAAETCEWILSRGIDSFGDGTSAVSESVRTRVLQWLTQPGPLRDAFERRYGPIANRNLEQAADSPAMLADGLAIFSATDAGRDARIRLAVSLLDRGESGLADSIFREISPSGGKAGPTDWQPRAALAARIASTDKVEGGVAASDSALASASSMFPWVPGSGRRSRWELLDSSPPIVASEFGYRSGMQELTWQSWAASQLDTGRPAISASCALRLGDWLAVRELGRIVWLNLASRQVEGATSFREPDLGLPQIGAEPRARGRLPVLLGDAANFSGQGIDPQDSRRWFQDWTSQTLSADGLRAYCVTACSVTASGTPKNSLVACALPIDGRVVSQPVWIADGTDSTSAWRGTRFLGAPLSLSFELLVVAERESLVWLLSIDTNTGKQRWGMPLAAELRGEEISVDRQLGGCSPVLVDGLLICPTGNGLLVAVDYLTRSLAWVRFCASPEALLGDNRRPQGQRSGDDNSGGPHRLLLCRDRVIYRPPVESRIYCLSSATGEPIWTAPGSSGEQVVAATPDDLIVAGANQLRCLNAGDGSVRWTRALTQPVGTGLLAHGEYWQPEQGGRLSRFRLADGNSRGVVTERPTTVLGNLVPVDDTIISVSPLGLEVLPTVDRLDGQIAKMPNSGRRQALEAELLLARDELSQAVDRLLAAAESGELPDDERQRVAGLLVNAGFLEFEQTAKPSLSRLEAIAPYCSTPEQRVGYLVRLSRTQIRSGRSSDAISSLIDLLETPRSDLLQVPGDEKLFASPEVFVAMQLNNQLQDELETPTSEALARRLIARALQSSDSSEIWRYTLALGDRITPELLEHLARSALREHRYQSAELAWLGTEACRSPDAWPELAALWMQCDWPLRARTLARERGLPWPLLGFPESREDVLQRRAGFRVRDLVATSSAIAEFGPLELRRPEFGAGRLGAIRRKYPTADDSPVDLLLTLSGSGTRQELQVVDRFSQRVLQALPVESLLNVSDQVESRAESFLPLSTTGGVMGLSLLEMRGSEPLWVTRPRFLQGRNRAPYCGPVCSFAAIYQSRQALFAVHPATGRVLWMRDDLDPRSGLEVERTVGIFGDERVTVVFDPERVKYTVYETRTGRRLRAGELTSDIRKPRKAIGRLFVCMETVDEKSVLKIWDPLDDRILFTRAVNERAPFRELPNNQLLLLTRDATIESVDAPTGKVRWSHPVTGVDAASLTGMHVARVGETLLVNLQRPVPVTETRYYTYTAHDAHCALAHMRDDVFAFHEPSGRLLWTRPFPQRTILRVAGLDLPILVLAARIRDPADGTRQWLSLEVVDSTTGKTIGRPAVLPWDRLLSADYDNQTATIRLIGQKEIFQIQLLDRAPVDWESLTLGPDAFELTAAPR
ncbi:MAG: PQQ-binding-like beta-propeller repeat protein [Planctomycetaceae bacterium]|nr:PQQ-binding-like beta-propeller repeat protein [Planctomycetaceae bacterium]